MFSNRESGWFEGCVLAGLTVAVSFVVVALAHAGRHVQAFI